MDEVECVGLFGPALTIIWTGLRAFFDFVFGLVCNRDSDVRIPAPLALQREKAAFSCVVTLQDSKESEKHFDWK